MLAYRLLRMDLVAGAFFDQVIVQLALGTFLAVVVWLSYLAIEPYLRRSWPRLLVGWHRLLVGRVQDPLVGRESLLGLTAGAVWIALTSELAVWMHITDIPYSPPLQMLGRSRDIVAVAFSGLWLACVLPLLAGLILLLTTLVLRRRSLAIGGLWVMAFLLLEGWIFDLEYALALKTLTATFVVLVLIRLGLVGLATMIFAGTLLAAPLTLDPSAWYFPHALLPMLVLLGLGGWAAWRSLGDQPHLARLLGEEPLPASGG